MSEKQTSQEGSPSEGNRPPVSPEQARAARHLYARLAQFVSTHGEPARLDLFGVMDAITQATQSDIDKPWTSYDEFSDDGQYIGERNARYTDRSGNDHKVRLVVANESGISKLGVLAELDLESDVAENVVERSYRFYPDMNIRYHRDEWVKAGEAEDDYAYSSNADEEHYLTLDEVEALSLEIDSLHVINK